MKNFKIDRGLLYLSLVLFTGLWSCKSAEKEVPAAEWENPEVFAINKEEPHAHFVHYPSRADAIAGGETSSFYQSLNGTWKFNFARKPADRPKNFYQDGFSSTAYPY